MNTQRFGWPVIIAAGLHGALLLITPETTARGDPPPRDAPTGPIHHPGSRIEIEPEPDYADADSPAMTSCALAPTSIDVPRDLRSDAPFTVPIESSRISLTRVSTVPLAVGPHPGVGDAGGWGGGRVPDVGQLDRVPRATLQPAPVYPGSARREGVSGIVWIEFVVGPSGEVVRADAVRWTRPDFVGPAEKAVRRWRFEPGRMNGRPVSFRMAVPIEFNATQ